MSHTQSKFAHNISAHAAARYWQATLARDSRADGSFVLAVRSTHIYCRPSCPARRPLRRNVTFFRTREEAEKQGYRPCLRCRPNEIAGPVALVQRAASQLAESSEESMRLGVLARTLGTTQATLRRAFLRVTGLKPRELAEALRIKRFKAMLRAGKSIADALYETGYEDRIHNCEIASRKSSSCRHGARCLGGLSRRCGEHHDCRTARGISACGNCARHGFVPALGAGDRAAHRRQTASVGTPARPAGDGVSAARVAGATADSARQDAHVLGSRAITWQAQGCPGRGESLRHEPRVHRGAVPSRHTRRRDTRRLSLGALAKGTVARAGARRRRVAYRLSAGANQCVCENQETARV